MSTTQSAATTAATYTASGSAVIFGLSANEFAAIAGVCIALLTFGLNWYYKHQQIKLICERLKDNLPTQKDFNEF